MPTYEYACEACGNTWEVQQRISEAPLKKCPACGKRKAKRLVSGGTGVIFKGGGWYADLYHKPKKGGAKPEAAEAASSSDSSTDAKPEKKPAKPKKAAKPKK